MTGLLIYSRLSSLRLPGKALLKLGGTEMLKRIYERAAYINADKIIAAIAKEPSDDPLAEFLEKENISYFRGDLNDVALRTTECIKKFNLSYFIRVNGDSPLFPVNEMNYAIAALDKNKYDFVTNLAPRTYPYGYAVEIINAELFCKSYPEFNSEEREHITSYFYSNKEKFFYKNISLENNNYSGKIFLTVDDHDSYSFINDFFTKYPDASGYELDEIVYKYNTIKNRHNTLC